MTEPETTMRGVNVAIDLMIIFFSIAGALSLVYGIALAIDKLFGPGDTYDM